MMNSFKNILPTWLRVSLYHAYYYSRLTYGISLWAPPSLKCNSKRLHGLHKKVLRAIGNAKYNESVENLLKRLKLFNRVNLELSKISYRYKNETLPPRVYKLFGDKPKHKYNTRRKSNPLC